MREFINVLISAGLGETTLKEVLDKLKELPLDDEKRIDEIV
jgi:hypothetical protein